MEPHAALTALVIHRPSTRKYRMAEQHDYVFKLLLVGDAGVGKSSILLRYTDDTFDENLQSTIGVDFKVKVVNRLGKSIKLTIWDTAGQERFRTLTSSYYRGAQGIVLTYDVTRRDTFEALSVWLQEVDVYSPGGGQNVIKLLVGNKIDKEPRAVSRREGESFARAKGMLFLESSAKTKKGIQEVFDELLQKIMDNPTLMNGASSGRRHVTRLDSGYSTGADDGCGC